MDRYSASVGSGTSILWRMRRRNASSTSDFGSRLVEKTINSSKGISIFLPVCSVRNIHVAFEQVPSDGLRDGRLAVAGRAVHEHGATGIDGRADLAEGARAEHQFGQRDAHVLRAHDVAGDALRAHALGPHGDRHG